MLACRGRGRPTPRLRDRRLVGMAGRRAQETWALQAQARHMSPVPVGTTAGDTGNFWEPPFKDKNGPN